MTTIKEQLWFDIVGTRNAGRKEEADDLEIIYSA